MKLEELVYVMELIVNCPLWYKVFKIVLNFNITKEKVLKFKIKTINNSNNVYNLNLKNCLCCDGLDWKIGT